MSYADRSLSELGLFERWRVRGERANGYNVMAAHALTGARRVDVVPSLGNVIRKTGIFAPPSLPLETSPPTGASAEMSVPPPDNTNPIG